MLEARWNALVGARQEVLVEARGFAPVEAWGKCCTGLWLETTVEAAPQLGGGGVAWGGRVWRVI